MNEPLLHLPKEGPSRESYLHAEASYTDDSNNGPFPHQRHASGRHRVLVAVVERNLVRIMVTVVVCRCPRGLAASHFLSMRSTLLTNNLFYVFRN